MAARFVILIPLLPGMLCAGACHVDRPPDLNPPIPPVLPPMAAIEDGPPRWPYWPRSMRIHPASRIATDRDRGDEIIELRLQFRDDSNDIVKAVGRLSIDLFDAAGGEHATAVKSWTPDLADPALNEESFDDVTMTYLLRLELGAVAVPADPALAVRFDSADGAILTDLASLRRQGQP